MVKSEFVRALNEKLPDSRLDDVELALNCILAQVKAEFTLGKKLLAEGN